MDSWIIGIIGSILATGFITVTIWAVRVIRNEMKNRFDQLEKKIKEIDETNKVTYKMSILALEGLVKLGVNGHVKKARDKYIEFAIDN